MSVTRDDLQAHLERVVSKCKDPVAGIDGPESKPWHIDREALVFPGAGRAVLLQTAHPHVAHGVDRHSKTRADILLDKAVAAGMKKTRQSAEAA